MKKLLMLCLVFTFSFTVNGQIETPAPSPFQKIEQVVGLTDVHLEYSRPAMRGRVIFGDLVPFGKVWRTGANSRTKITFGDDVTVGGQKLEAGSYGILTIPQADSWEVIFYSEADGGGAPAQLDEEKIAARVKATTVAMPMNIDSFTISFDDLTSSSAVLGFMWEKTYVGVEFEVPTDDMVSAAIDRIMSGPGAGDYYAAAVYYLSEGKDISMAKKWMDKAMSMTENPRFWQLRQQSLIYAKAGDTKGAIELAKRSLAAAEKAGNADYVKMNKESIAEWMQ
ncbi:MAG: DUF2911 domain-containing protein [Flavobacteriaceae bacterium]|nr:DUF2911 domain-containing protein [Bacteroidia bacterium]NNK88956.1 DUF2911 domain-containing protein [Flavobacteriaceae bacterium]